MCQFETIHPFLDGNGRVGRLLITLLFYEQQVMSQPLLYLSLYLKRNRQQYYDLLQRLRYEGAWEAWLRFFLEGVVDVATGATTTTKQIVQVIEEDRARIHQTARQSTTAVRLHQYAVEKLVVRASRAAQALEVTEPPIYKAIAYLVKARHPGGSNWRNWGRTYVYGRYLEPAQRGDRGSFRVRCPAPGEPSVDLAANHYGPYRDRTCDLGIKSPLLYQLS